MPSRRARGFQPLLLLSLFAALLAARPAAATTHVIVATGDTGPFRFTPKTRCIAFGDTVRWDRLNGTHTTSEHDGVPCSSVIPPNLWSAPLDSTNTSFTFVFDAAHGISPDPAIYEYECQVHCDFGMNGRIILTPSGSCPTPVPESYPLRRLNWGEMKIRMLEGELAP